MLTKIKGFVKQNFNDIILVITVVLISLLSFAVGFVLAEKAERIPLRIEYYEEK